MLFWFSIVLFALIVALLLLKIRVRLVWGDVDRTVFLGVGQSGAELDFITKLGEVTLFGARIKRFGIKRSPKETQAKPQEGAAEEPSERETLKKESKKRSRPIRDWLSIVPSSTKALWKYGIGMFRAVKVEEARGQITAGFESPDLTGQLFGYYQAVAAVAPKVRYIEYTPVWHQRYFSGSVRFAVGLPVYRLVGETLLLFWRLPITRIVKLAIGKRKVVQDVK